MAPPLPNPKYATGYNNDIIISPAAVLAARVAIAIVVAVNVRKERIVVISCFSLIYFVIN